MEHNAVMRPLTELSKRNNLTIGILPHGPDGMIDVEKIGSCLKSNTRLVIINHQSNVNGVIQPVGEIKERIGEIPMLIDTAQSFGHSILSLDSWGIEFAAFTGHKGILGPTGTGGLYISKTEKVLPLFYGGTGSRSESYEMPEFLPDKFEAGTPNVAGIYGLLGAINDRPTPAHREQDFINLLNEVDKIPFLKLHRAKDTHAQGLLFSISHIELSCSKIAEKLYEKFSIEIRSGLHCAPLAHKTIGTFPSGTARFAPSIYHTPKDFEYLLEALHMLNKL
jgi:selenocysteine lyase/cysteine desulfurase